MADEEKKDVTADPEPQAQAGLESTSPGETKEQVQDEVVPKKAFLARVGEESEKRKAAEEALQRERERIARLEGELDAIRKTQSNGNGNGQPQRRLTWAELEAMTVENGGQYTRAQIEAYKEETARLMAQEEGRKAASEVVSERDIFSTLQRDRQRYVATVPGLFSPGTEANQKAEAAYARLRARGLPHHLSTEVAALELAFGDLETLERASRSPDLTAQHRDTHQETPSSRSQNTQPHGGPQEQVKRRVSPAEYETYERMIRSGAYPGWKDVLDELNFATEQTVNPRLRARELAKR